MIVERGEVGAEGAAFKPLVATALPWTILALGALLRLVWYFDRGSLWLDESFLALNIVHRSPTELLERLSFAQGAPWGFLLAEKLSVATFGVDEQSLRLVPLLAALVSLPVFWRVASFYLEGRALLLSLLLFSLSPQLILFSAEAKQYSVDVLASLLALWLLHSARQLAGWHGAVVVGLGGALLIWFSHASMIVLGAGGVVVGAAALIRRRWSDVGRLSLVGAAWASSAGAFYLWAWPKLRALHEDVTGAEQHSVPFPPDALDDLWVLARRTGDVLEIAFGFHGRPWSSLIVVAAALFVVAGGVALARRDAIGSALVVAPIFAVATAVATGLYPFSVRFVLFLVPLVVLLVAAGAAAALDAAARPDWTGRAVAGAAGVAALCLVAAAGVGSARVITRQPEQDIKPVLDELRAAWRPGDALYLHAGSQYAARFYAEANGLHRSNGGDTLWPVVPTESTRRGAPALRSAPPVLLVGEFREGGDSTFARDLVSLDGRPRVWFVFSHVVRSGRGATPGDLDEHVAALDAAGSRRATIRHSSARALLYDLRR
jgi:Dolichyl-phosphate-mannose-protein mannosyltransferase